MPAKVVVGMKTGDEGKAAVIDRLEAALTVRFQGGCNAGHTVVDEQGVEFIFHMLPSAFLRKGKAGIGKGVVGDLSQLDREVADLENMGHEVKSRLYIDEKMMLVLPYHRIQDAAEEFYREHILGEEPVGSTRRGISPAYADEAGRRAIYAFHLKDRDRFAELVKRMCMEKEGIIRAMGVPPDKFAEFFDQITEKEKRAASKRRLLERKLATEYDLDFTRFRQISGKIKFNSEEMAEVYWNTGRKFLDCLTDLKLEVLDLLRKDEDVLFEGAQGCRLDKREGYSPNVTASHTTAASACIGIGIAPRYIDSVCGVTKAYETKVGNHNFVTKMADDEPLTERLKKLEFGATTGRQRMVGWFDGVEMRTAQILNGCTEIVITKLDPFSGASELKLCIGYKDPQSGKTYEYCPQDNAVVGRVEPVWITCKGWPEDITGCTRWGELPKEAQVYVAHIASTFADSIKDLPRIASIGTGPRRNQFIKDVPSTYELLKLSAKNQ